MEETKNCLCCGENKLNDEFNFKMPRDKITGKRILGIRRDICIICEFIRNKIVPSEKECNKCLIIKNIRDFNVLAKKKKVMKDECKTCEEKEKLSKIEIQSKRRKNASYKGTGDLVKVFFRKCRDCTIYHPVSEFRVTKKIYYDSYCFVCQQIRTKIDYDKNGKAQTLKHKKKAAIRGKKIYKKNREKVLAKQKERIKNNPNRQYEIYRKNYEKNRTAIILRTGISARIRRQINKNGDSFENHINYTMNKYQIHLQKLFEPWMNFDNMGVYTLNSWKDNDQSTWVWHVDHIIPHSFWKYKEMDEAKFKMCWSLKNLRPLLGKQNVCDGNQRKISIEFLTELCQKYNGDLNELLAMAEEWNAKLD